MLGSPRNYLILHGFISVRIEKTQGKQRKREGYGHSDSRVRERIMKLRARSDEISLKERRVGSDVSVQEMTEGKSCASRPKRVGKEVSICICLE